MVLTNKLTLNQIKMAAENCYLTYDFFNAIKYDSLFLKNHKGKYPFLIIKEHMAAYTFASFVTNTKNNAKNFYINLLEIYKFYLLPIHQIDLLISEVKKQIDIINGNIIEYIKNDVYKEPKKYMNANDFFNGLLKNHIKYYANNETAIYYDMLYIYKYGYPDDFIRYYEQYKDSVNNKQIHIKAAKIYCYFNRLNDAYNALTNYIKLNTNINYEIPMSLFLNYSLYKLYSYDLFEKCFNKNI